MTLKEKINAVMEPLTNGAVDLINTTCDFGFKFEEAFPATIIRPIEIDGKFYKAVMELTFEPIGE